MNLEVDLSLTLVIVPLC